jgi:2-hydroxy-3-keto-5-methylthiopentenyl-1-phosphate phosphatase
VGAFTLQVLGNSCGATVNGEVPVPPIHVLLDFDGTLVQPNVAILLVEQFCPDGKRIAHEVDAALHAGQLTLREAWAQEVALLPADRVGEMVDYVLREVPLRAGARGLLDLLREFRVPTAIVSGGLDFFIRPILGREGIDYPLFSDSMEIALPPSPRTLRVTHPFGHPSCRLCGICKAQVTLNHALEGVRTVFIGDGSTDRYAAEVAEIVFARHRLKEYCERLGIPLYPFEEFGPVTAQMRRWIMGLEPWPPRRARGVRASPCPISRDVAARTLEPSVTPSGGRSR